MDCCEKLLDAMRHNNLVPLRQVFRRGVALANPIAGNDGRLEINLKRSQRAAGYALVLQARQTLGAAAAAVVQFSLNDPGSAGNAQAAMADQQTLFLQAGQTMVQPLPGWTDKVTLDLRGGLASDPGTAAEAYAIVVVYELVPTLFSEGC